VKPSWFSYAFAAVLVAPAMVVALSAPAHADVPTCGGRPATIVATPRVHRIRGTEGDDVIVGLPGADDINGLGGDDLICGRGGDDGLTGGEGHDVLYGQWGEDQLWGGPGDDVMRGGAGLGGAGATLFWPDDGNDTWISWTKYVFLAFWGSGTTGVTVDLQAGTATGWGNDRIQLHRASSVSLTGSEGDDTLLGGPTQDHFYGDGGSDTMDGRGGDDHVGATCTGVASGGDGNDTVIGDAPSSCPEGSGVVIDGGPGDDLLVPGHGDTVSAGPGDDRISVGVSSWSPLTPRLSLDGGEGHDLLTFSDGQYAPGTFQQMIFDMPAGTLVADTFHLSATGFEDFRAEDQAGCDTCYVSTTYDVTGTDGPNDIRVGPTFGAVVIRAGDGDDAFDGSVGDDTLVGGPGVDRANAKSGNDTCQAIEYLVNCEVVEP
jgi:Ca2+-binding RTX toxin-like protein